MRVTHLSLIALCGFWVSPLRADDDTWGDEFKVLRESAKFALYSGDLDLLKALVNAKLDVNRPLETVSGDTALHIAVRPGKLDMIHFLIKHGAKRDARNKDGQMPIDQLHTSKDMDLEPIIRALERPLTAFDKTLLAGFPTALWRGLLRPPKAQPDPLEPVPPFDDEQRVFVPFISINGDDPPLELAPALTSRYPGWKPASAATPPPSSIEKPASTYWDKASKRPGERILITLAPISSSEIDETQSDALCVYARKHTLPAYSFGIRTIHGPVMAGGGCYGYVVLVGGYWVTVGMRGVDE